MESASPRTLASSSAMPSACVSLSLTSSDLPKWLVRLFHRVLRRCTKLALDTRKKKIFVFDAHQRLLAADHFENGGVHVWCRHKDGARHDKGHLGSHVVLDRNGQASVSLGVWLSRNAVGHLPLHHDHELAEGNLALNQVHEDRGGDVVGQVGHDLDGQIRVLKVLNLGLQVGLEDVLVDHGHIVKATQGVRQNRNQAVVNLKSQDLSGILRQNSVKAPIPGPISMTLTFRSISAVSTIFCKILVSVKNFDRRIS